MRGQKGVQEQCTVLPSPHSLKNYSDDSCCLLSDNTISMKWVLFRICTPSTLLSTHSNISGGNLNATYSLFPMFTPFYKNTQQNINNCITMSTCINVCLTNEHMNEGGEMSDSERIL